MRTLLVLVLLSALAGGGVWLARQHGLAPSSVLDTLRGPAAAPTPSAPPAGAVAEAGAPAEAAPTHEAVEAPASGTRVYYQYVDASGAVRFVDRLEDVPAPHRDAAGRIEVEARPERAPAARAAAQGRRPWAAAAAAPTVVVYTTSWCGWCRKTLAWLDREGVDYVNKDIEADPDHREELIRKAGRASIPVVDVDGTLIRGYDPGRMEALIGS
jgi:glutaredoxin